MSNEVLVDIKNVSKKFSKNYKVGAKEGLRRTLKRLFGFSDKTTVDIEGHEFLALDNVSLQVRRGEAVGLLGKNGAGKSTLLKHISGIYLPDSGSVKVRGHVEALIELGAGFHPLLSGRENIKQRCAMLGFSKDKTQELIDEIIEFSELSDFVDMPVQNYSSGMKARLGFSSAVIVKPDVLLVDEVLSVGDFEFKQKCLSKINEIKKEVAIILVSHSDQTMRMFCQSAVCLQNGKKIYEGDMESAQEEYLRNRKRLNAQTLRSPLMGKEFINKNKLKSVQIKLNDEAVSSNKIIRKREKINISVTLEVADGVGLSDLTFSIPFYRGETYLGAVSSDYIRFKSHLKTNKVELIFEVVNMFNRGVVDSVFSIYEGIECLGRFFIPRFEVINNNSREHGEFLLDFKMDEKGYE